MVLSEVETLEVLVQRLWIQHRRRSRPQLIPSTGQGCFDHWALSNCSASCSASGSAAQGASAMSRFQALDKADSPI
eukprot:13068317-Alexandrium_andersonii.AAC.1